MPTPTNTKPFKKPMYSYGSTPFGRRPIKATASKYFKKDEWGRILSYVSGCSNIRMNLCSGCGKGTLYDNSGKAYPISRRQTLEEVKLIVEEILVINNKK